VVFFSTAVFEKVGVPSAVAASALVMATNIAGTVGASRWCTETVGLYLHVPVGGARKLSF